MILFQTSFAKSYDETENLREDMAFVWPLIQTVKIEYELANAQIEFLETKAEKVQYMEEFEKFIMNKYFKKVLELQLEQGQLLLLLIHKEIGKTPYELLSSYRNNNRANFWQQFARIIGTNLKEEYSAEKYPLVEAEIIHYKLNGTF
ncbi:MAG: DUF4294 domain-containing protein [Prolixibacteraceae bacterium]|nr:DUF4294 domain-containing protein [Prolixibacteraceae bacterium]